MPRPRALLRHAARRTLARLQRLSDALCADRGTQFGARLPAPLRVKGDHALDGFGWRNTYTPTARSEKQHAANRGSYRPLSKRKLRAETDAALADAIERVTDADDVGLTAASVRDVARQIVDAGGMSSRDLFRAIDAAKRQED